MIVVECSELPRLRSLWFLSFQAEDGIRDWSVTGVQTCALPICSSSSHKDNGRATGLGQSHQSTGNPRMASAGCLFFGEFFSTPCLLARKADPQCPPSPHYPCNVPILKLPGRLVKTSTPLFTGPYSAMQKRRQPELQQRLGAVSQRLEELSAVPPGVGNAEEFLSLFQEKRRIEARLRAGTESHLRSQSKESSTLPAHGGHDFHKDIAQFHQLVTSLPEHVM